MKTKSSITIIVTDADAGSRLDKFLIQIDEINSRTFAKTLIDKDLVKVDSKIAKASLTVQTGQSIEITFPETAPSELLPFDFKLDIVFEDDDLIVINKPSGLVVHPAAGHEQDTLVNALLAHTKNLSMKNEQRPGIVHRIDKETSGLLVIAKNDFTHEKLSEQFRNKTTHRIYYALVDGVFQRANGSYSSYLARHPVERKRYASVRDNNKVINKPIEGFLAGKWAVTHFSKVAQHSGMAYMKIRLETGRTHQIRVHMSDLGHPLVGDLAYGFSLRKYRELQVKRFFLNAAELGFTHPRTEENLLFKTGWPTEDEKLLNSLGFDKATLEK